MLEIFAKNFFKLKNYCITPMGNATFDFMYIIYIEI